MLQEVLKVTATTINKKLVIKKGAATPHRIAAPRLMIEIRFILYSHVYDHYDRA